MPVEIDDDGNVIREWTLTPEEIQAFIDEVNERWPGLLERLADA